MQLVAISPMPSPQKQVNILRLIESQLHRFTLLPDFKLGLACHMNRPGFPGGSII